MAHLPLRIWILIQQILLYLNTSYAAAAASSLPFHALLIHAECSPISFSISLGNEANLFNGSNLSSPT